MTGLILLIRHGETEWNLQRRFQGRLDSPLTEQGIAQAHAIGRLLETRPETEFASVVASPLGRAQRTAALLRDHLPAGAAMSSDDRLRELSLGSWDGLTYQEIALRAPGVFDGDGRFEWYFRSPDGERYDAFAGRLADWLGDWTCRGVLVVVTHGIVTRVLRGLYAGLPRGVALTLPVSQDKIYHLHGGRIEQLPVPQPDAGPRRNASERSR